MDGHVDIYLVTLDIFSRGSFTEYCPMGFIVDYKALRPLLFDI